MLSSVEGEVLDYFFIWEWLGGAYVSDQGGLLLQFAHSYGAEAELFEDNVRPSLFGKVHSRPLAREAMSCGREFVAQYMLLTLQK